MMHLFVSVCVRERELLCVVFCIYAFLIESHSCSICVGFDLYICAVRFEAAIYLSFDVFGIMYFILIEPYYGFSLLFIEYFNHMNMGIYLFN